MVRVVKDPEARRAEIVQAASRLFLYKGYEATTMLDVMRAVGVAKGTIYHYYNSKEELLDAVLEQMIASEKTRLQQVFAALEGSALERFQQFIAAMSSEQHDETFLDHLHKPANAGMHIRLQAATTLMVAPFLAELCILGNQEGLLAVTHPLETAEFILAATTYLTDLGIYPWSDERLQQRIQAIPDLIERQLGAPPGSFAFLRAPLTGNLGLESTEE